ncbi:hypothetical protein C8F04DRAFT_1136463 [Mycena alexandri]|uniref:Uncharacterized protein n=1 Tax=Mycena alexandri TaxID=1745969 RepID=A0AAD6S8M8_9AGAR|nr:hypothetical protein C8F04DRAFT_1136463 [Mycena alexandri]
MSFDTDASWPVGLLRIFDIARTSHGSFENRYYGAYTKMLTYCFGEGFDFVVAPQAPPTDKSRDTVDFIVYFIVFDVAQQRPVFLVEVKDDAHNLIPTKRKAADEQMRERYDELLRDCPIPLLYGLSVLGTGMRVYCGNKARKAVTPPFVETNRHFVLPDDYLQDEWSVDILSPGGFSKMKQIVAYIKDESAKL